MVIELTNKIEHPKEMFIDQNKYLKLNDKELKFLNTNEPNEIDVTFQM